MPDIAIRVDPLSKLYPSTPLKACPECGEGTGIGRNGAGKSTHLPEGRK